MKLSVLAVLFQDRSFDEACKYLAEHGAQAVDIAAGGYPGKKHCDPADFLKHPEKIDEMMATVKKYGLEISALSAHGNPVHPNKEIAKQFHEDFENAVLLAEKMGVDTIVGFSGCPGGSPEDKMPNWVTCAWPDDYLDVVKYQWEEVLIPYWKKEVEFVKAHGIKKIAFEMHPGFCVYNPETLLKLRAEVGDIIGANFDPSHLVWQGIDPVAAIRNLGDAIYYFHAKDTKIDPINTAVNGVLDYKHYGDELKRSWIFRSVGYGHGQEYWKDIMSALRLVGYDGYIAIEHEDSLMTSEEGLNKAIASLKDSMMFDKRGGMFWA